MTRLEQARQNDELCYAVVKPKKDGRVLVFGHAHGGKQYVISSKTRILGFPFRAWSWKPGTKKR